MQGEHDEHLHGPSLAQPTGADAPISAAGREPEVCDAEGGEDLAARLAAWEQPADAEKLQEMVYAVGRDHGFEPMKDWFAALYQVLLGADQGPRFGGFIALYGVKETAVLIDAALDPMQVAPTIPWSESSFPSELIKIRDKNIDIGTAPQEMRDIYYEMLAMLQTRDGLDRAEHESVR